MSLNLIIQKIKQPYFNFYKANSYLGLGELDKAKDLFNIDTAADEAEFKAEANWYLALINLKQHNKPSH